MTRQGLSSSPENPSDTNNANVINFETVSGHCVNCEQKLNRMYNNDNETDSAVSEGVVAFTSFFRSTKTQVVIGDAVKELYSILNVLKADESRGSGDNSCALCVDCCLIFAQLYGLLQLFESRQKTDGFLQTSLIHALRWGSRDEPKS